MKDEKEMEHCECHHFGGGHLLFTLGLLAFLYGVVNYLRVMYSWPPYMGWVVGGLALIVVGFAKKKYWMGK